MESVVCPNCGNEISIPDSMPSEITCNKCQREFGVEYEVIQPLTFKEKVRKFTRDHQKSLLGIVAIGIAACGGYAWLQDIKEKALTESTALQPESLTEDPNIPAENSCSEATAVSDVNIPDDYARKLVEHGLSIRNLGENRYPSAEKRQQAKDLGIDLETHQTIVNDYSQHHRIKKDNV